MVCPNELMLLVVDHAVIRVCMASGLFGWLVPYSWAFAAAQLKSILRKHCAASVGDWCPTFRKSAFLSFSVVVCPVDLSTFDQSA